MSSTTERKLAAIMFTDIAGYTAQMSKDEAKAMELLKQKESILKPLLKKYKGTFVKSIGDGTLSYFESAINAASCAVRLQEIIYDQEDLNIRAGIHIGDIVFKDDDVFGDGVNISARLENMAPVGGVCVSKNVYDELMNQKGFEGVDLGLQSLKGVGRLVEVYGLKGSKLKEPKPEDYKNTKVSVDKDDKVPSIAVIPFENKGADEDVFYAYGISSDLIKEITSAGIIKVSSLSDIQKIENYNKLSLKDLSDKLNIRYVAQGSLWKMNDIFQISIELYDSNNDVVLWSDRWQENWENLSVIQDSLYKELTKILNRYIEDKPGSKIFDPEAYRIYLEALYLFENRKSKTDIDKVIELYKKALDIDPNMIGARCGIVWAYMRYNIDEAEKYNNELKKYLDKNPNVDEIFLFSYYSYEGWISEHKTARDIALKKTSKKIFSKALDNFKKSMEIAERNNNFNQKLSASHNIARNYLNEGYWNQDNKQLKLHDKCCLENLEFAKKIKDENVGPIYSNLAKSYLWQQKYDEAEKYIKLDHDLSIKNNSQFGLSFVYAKYITLYLEYYDDINKAKEYLRKVKIIGENLENWGGLASIYAEFSRYYKSKGDIEEEKKYNDLKIKYIEMRDNRNS